MSNGPIRHALARGVVTLCLVAGLFPAAQAARLHVLPGGTRAAGVSTPDDWSAANCYPTLAAAAVAASAPDTLLLSDDDHAVTSVVLLPAMLGNRRLDSVADSCRVVMGPAGALRLGSGPGDGLVRGIHFAADAAGPGEPALTIAASGPAGFEVDGCVFTGFQGTHGANEGGAAIFAEATSASIVVEIRGSAFRDNSSPGSGGAICAADGVELRVLASSFERNESRLVAATVYGGSIASFAGILGSSLLLEDTTIDDSVCWGPGGAVYVQDGDLTMRDTAIRGSRSAFGNVTRWSAGAGVFVRRVGTDPVPTQVVVERCDFIDNRGDLTQGIGAGDGGGMMIRGSDDLSPVEITIRDCRFQNNFNDQGGGLYVGRSVTGTIERTLFLENTAYTNGGGAYKGGGLEGNIGETALFAYCVFARNRAGWDQNGNPVPAVGWGGGFMVRLNPRAELHNCTFVDNSSGIFGKRGDAAFFWNEGLSITDERQRSRIVNCVFWGLQGTAEQVRADYLSLQEVVHSAWAPGEFIAVTIPQIGTLLLNDTPFAGTNDFRPKFGSDLIDGGVDLGYSHDIALLPVPMALAPDVGAHEYLVPTATTPTTPRLDALVRLLPAWPNPANPRARIAFSLERASRVQLSVHDARGRRVAQLLDAALDAGRHEVVWDGRDAQGAEAASGIYLIRVTAGGTIATGKLALVR